jgi:hypothetical protein
MGWGGMKVRWERWKRGLVGKLSFSVLMAGGISHICISFFPRSRPGGERERGNTNQTGWTVSV